MTCEHGYIRACAESDPASRPEVSGLELRECDPPPEQLTIKEIIIDGVKHGRVEPVARGEEPPAWHAIMDLQDKPCLTFHSLLQGHGKTPQEAIAMAILRAREELDWFSHALDRMECILGTYRSPNDLLRSRGADLIAAGQETNSSRSSGLTAGS